MCYERIIRSRNSRVGWSLDGVQWRDRESAGPGWRISNRGSAILFLPTGAVVDI